MRGSHWFSTAGVAIALVSFAGGAEAVTRCQVLEHAQHWVDKRIMYSQGPGGGYCAGGMYCDPEAGGACYRPDCSGFVSAVWGVAAPGNSTYSFAGGVWDNGVSHVIGKNDLKPGDALNYPGNPNVGTGHIRLFGGWVDAAKTRLWGYETSTCGTPAHRWEMNWSDFGAYVPIRYNKIEECTPGADGSSVAVLPQVSGNRAITVVNWEGAQHAEVWVKSSDGRLLHGWTSANDDWSPLEQLANSTSCGFAATFWPNDLSNPSGAGHAEVFMPTPAGNVASSWFNYQNGWMGPADFGGQGVRELSTLLWPDGRVEIFGLGNDSAIWHKWWTVDTNRWSDWAKFGDGKFATGATAIVWGNGHPEVFATGVDGIAWHRWYDPAKDIWSEWQSDLGGDLASRPIPVRWDDGRVEVFARSKDGYLNHAFYDANNQWNPMRRLSDTPIKGEPSAVFNAKGNGGSTGPQIFVRDANDKLVTIEWQGGWTAAKPLLQDKTLGSDPFGWVRGDGTIVLFAIDDAGQLVRSTRDANGNFKPWSSFSGPTLDACVAPSPPPNDNTSTPGPDDGVEPGGDPVDDSAGNPANNPPNNPADDSAGDSTGDSTNVPPGQASAANDDPSSSRSDAANGGGASCQISTTSGSSAWGFVVALAGLAGLFRRGKRS